MSLLEYRDVWKRYTLESFVLSAVSMTLESGDMTVVMGPNGSGKTTLIKLGGGLMSPTRGEVLVKGVSARSVKAKREIGIMLHEPMLYPELSVEENLWYYAKLRDSSLDGFPLEVAEILGLKKYFKRRVAELSYGWRKRADFVRSMLGEPSVILLDEPLAGLDPEGREGVSEILAELRRKGRAVLLTSPNASSDIDSLEEKTSNIKVYLIDGGVVRRIDR